MAKAIGRWLRYLAGILAVATPMICPAEALAGVIYFKDGFTVSGQVKREMEIMIDPATGLAVSIVKGNTNCYILDDRARYLVFSPKIVETADKEKDVFDNHVAFAIPIGSRTRSKLPMQARLGEPKPFDAKWERTYPFITDAGKFAAKQKVTIITPHFVRAESYDYDWTINYLTNEFTPETLLPLIRSHPDVAGKGDQPAAFDGRFRVYRFCAQAGWLPDAERELEMLKKDFPEQQEKLESASKSLQQQIQQKYWEDAELAARVGQSQRAAGLLRRLNTSELPAALQSASADLKTKTEAMQLKLEQTRRALATCYLDRLDPQPAWLNRAAAQIARDLNADTIDRLEPFTTIAQQIAQQARDGKPTSYTLDQALATAVSGWVMGPLGAEPSEATAERLWSLRESLLEFLRSPAAPDRAQIIERIRQQSQFTVPEIARVITLLPPADADTTRIEPLGERTTRAQFNQRPSYSYRLQLPPEYHSNRAYPLLVVLPNSTESTDKALAAWATDAARNGYVVISVDWGLARNKYEYTLDEHFSALECIRDVKRYLQIDSDRVFLTGNGEGANLAFDVGLSHPDVFAGVIPISGRPRAYATEWYWRNAQILPFYVVAGELSGLVRDWAVKLYDTWADKGFASLLVIYRGRPSDFYAGEIPTIFDWMNRKRRATALPELGRFPNSGFNGQEFQTLRSTDNRFYWVGIDQIHDKFTLADFTKKPTNATAATVHAVIRDGNQIAVTTRGIKKLSLWLGRVYDSTTGVKDMIDFSKPVRVTVNNRTVWNNQNKPLEVSLETMLEDFRLRADKERLFFCKVDFSISQ